MKFQTIWISVVIDRPLGLVTCWKFWASSESVGIQARSGSGLTPDFGLIALYVQIFRTVFNEHLLHIVPR